MKTLAREDTKVYARELKKALLDLGPFEVECAADPNADGATEFLLRHGDRVHRLLLEVSPWAEPERVSVWIGARCGPKQGRQEVHRVLAAPHLPERLAKICDAHDIGWVDLSGNVRLRFEGLYLRQKPTFKRRRRVADASAPERFLACEGVRRVALALLKGGDRTWSLKELAAESRSSIGESFKVSRWLLEREWAAKPKARQFRVIRPEALKEALESAAGDGFRLPWGPFPAPQVGPRRWADGTASPLSL